MFVDAFTWDVRVLFTTQGCWYYRLADQLSVFVSRIKREGKMVEMWASCWQDDGQVPQVSSRPHSLPASEAASAAKDTEVSATHPGNIIHQAASVMGCSVWQWSSGHKSKRAHKHKMTDGWEDSFGQVGRDEERKLKWDGGRRTAAKQRFQVGL